MRLAVLSSAESWYVRDLQRAASELYDVSVQPFPFTRIHSSISENTTVESGEETTAENSLSDFDTVLVRTMPPGSLEQVVFRMDALQRLEVGGVRVLNSPRAIEAAVDKYLTLAKLRSAGFTVPKTEVSQTIDEALAGFQRLGGDVVLKPLFGSEGRGITRINDEAIAERTYKLLIQLGAVIYQQEFVEHEGHDLRLFVVGEEVLGMRRSSQLDWRTNVSRGATTEPLQVTEELRDLARRATECVHAQIAGVDLLPAKDGRLLAIEVNAVPGWRALAKSLDVDVAKKLLTWLQSTSR